MVQFFLKQSNYSNDRRESNLNNRNTIKVYQNEIKKGTKPRARTKKTKKETEDIIKEFAGLQINEPNPEDDLQELKLNLMIIVRTQFRNQEYTYDLIKQFIDTKAQKNIVILQEIKEWLLAQDIASNKQIDSWMLDVMLDLKVDLIITKTNLESFDRIKGLVKNCYQKVKDNQDDVILLSKKTQINNFVGQDEDLVFYPKNYQSFLMQINGMSEKKAIAVCKRFKTLRHLVEHLRSLPQFDWSSIANIEVKQLDNKKHVIGEKLARTLYMLFTSENHMQYIYQN